jgi:hypothetical protein
MSALTFSDGALGREVQTRQHSGHTREMREQSCLSAKRTNDLVTTIFKIVELRGLEPLTFSLRRLHPVSHALLTTVQHGACCASSTLVRDSGAHMGHTVLSLGDTQLGSQTGR